MTLDRSNHSIALGLLALICAAGVAYATRYPPGPGGTCPDTLTIFKVQNPSATCHPATLDTVWGVRGIITGFDAKASAYSFYIQNTFADGAHPWTGADVFTGATIDRESERTGDSAS